MKNNNDRVFVIAILTELLLSAIVVLCMVLNYRTVNNANIQAETPTTVVIETSTESTKEIVNYGDNIKQETVSLIKKISKHKCSTTEALFIYECIVEGCEKYDIPNNYVFGMGAQESQFISSARNKRTKATGVLQICPDGLTDYNNWNGTNYELDDMFDVKLNIEVGLWNLKQQAYYLRKEPKVSYSDCIIAYNTGVGYFKKYKEDWYKGWNPIDKTDYGYLTKVLNFSSQFSSIAEGLIWKN